MTYPNDPESPRRDPLPPNEPVGPGTPPYKKEGYVDGRIQDDRLFVEEQRARDNDNAARGLLIGIILASLVGLGLAWYFLNRRDEQPVQQIIVPGQQSPSTTPQQSVTPPSPPNVDINVPSPQQSQAPAPNVNITVPSTQPSQANPPAINNNITVPSPAPKSETTPSTPTGPSDVAPGGDTTAPSPSPS